MHWLGSAASVQEGRLEKERTEKASLLYSAAALPQLKAREDQCVQREEHYSALQRMGSSDVGWGW